MKKHKNKNNDKHTNPESPCLCMSKLLFLAATSCECTFRIRRYGAYINESVACKVTGLIRNAAGANQDRKGEVRV